MLGYFGPVNRFRIIIDRTMTPVTSMVPAIPPATMMGNVTCQEERFSMVKTSYASIGTQHFETA